MTTRFFKTPPRGFARLPLLLAAGVLLLGLLHLALIGSGVWESEVTLRHGRVFRFETEPVDPLDLFRGRYVALGFQQARHEVDTALFRDWEKTLLPFAERRVEPTDGAARLRWPQKIWVAVEPGQDGWARITRWSPTPLEGDNAFAVKAKKNTLWDSERKASGKTQVRLEFPFSRFYMEESAAPEAERLTQRQRLARQIAQGADGKPAQERKPAIAAVVRIRGGTALLENLEVDGQPIGDYLRAHRAGK